jgi:class 3 adenylate cyclase
MSLKDDLQSEVSTVFRSAWATRDGTVVPADTDLKLTNDAVNLEATVLYADLADSTHLVDRQTSSFAAEIYKTFLHCAAKIIRSEGGEITAYDGDRIMAVYIGGQKNTSAVRSAMKIHFARLNIIAPAKQAQYSRNSYVLKHVTGVDTSKLLVARTGVRGANDLVWVGRAANYAAKLATLPDDHATYITKEVYDTMLADAKTSNGRSIWEAVRWGSFDNRIIYRSNWYWEIS